jgi:hypothetical protein
VHQGAVLERVEGRAMAEVTKLYNGGPASDSY